MQKDFIISEMTYLTVNDDVVDMRNHVYLAGVSFNPECRKLSIIFIFEMEYKNNHERLVMEFHNVSRASIISPQSEYPAQRRHVMHIGYMAPGDDADNDWFYDEKDFSETFDFFIKTLAGGKIRVSGDMVEVKLV